MSGHTTNRSGEQLYDMLKAAGWLPHSDRDDLSYRDIGNLMAALANCNGPDDDLNLRAEYRASRRELKDEISSLRSCINEIRRTTAKYV